MCETCDIGYIDTATRVREDCDASTIFQGSSEVRSWSTNFITFEANCYKYEQVLTEDDHLKKEIGKSHHHTCNEELWEDPRPEEASP